MIMQSDLTVDMHAEEATKYQQIKSVCKQLLSGWSVVPDSDIEISCISGGISNALYSVKPAASCNLPQAVFRIYGDNTEKFVDRHKELEIMPVLHNHGFGPALLAAFSNGRIESFLPLRCMTPEEMSDPQHAQHIATSLAKFHTVPIPTPRLAVTPFQRIKEWLEVARGLDFTDSPAKLAIFSTFDFDYLMKEVEGVEKAAARFESPVVFAHNDLLSGNIMIPNTNSNSISGIDSSSAHDAPSVEEGHSMTFIDFEYSDWAPRGFDWGNHFCEYAGFDCDYSRYPNTPQASLFLKAYLTAANTTSNTSNTDRHEGPSEGDVARAVHEANVFALAAHMYWGAWAFMQAKWSRIDFDYMGYAQLRWQEYEKRKDEFLSL